MAKSKKNNTKSVVITVVVCLLLIAIIGGIVAGIKHNKIDNPIDKLFPDNTSATAVYENQAIVNKLYVNPTLLGENKKNVDANIDALNGKTIYVVKQADVKKTYSADELNASNLDKTVSDLTSKSAHYTITVNAVKDTTYEFVVKYFVENVEKSSLIINYDAKTGKASFSDSYTDIKNKISFNPETGCIDFGGKMVILNQSDLTDEIEKLNGLSQKQYPSPEVVEDEKTDTTKPADKPAEPVTSATAVLEKKNAVNRIYLNPNLDEARKNLLAYGSIKDVAQLALLAPANIVDTCNTFDECITAVSESSNESLYYSLISCSKMSVTAVSSETGVGQVLFDYQYHEVQEGAGANDYCSFEMSLSNGDLVGFDSVTNSFIIPDGYVLVINEAQMDLVKNLNLISTVQYPAVAA